MAETPIKTRLILFSALLVTVLLLVILYAGGILRFGLSQQFTYILYAIAGLLAAVTCFGLLSSFGKVNGERNGVNLELGGAIVAFVVVTGGGALYEKYFHTPETIGMTIRFVQEDGQPQNVTGVATLFIGTEPKVIQVKDQPDVTFQGIPSNNVSTPISFTLQGNCELVHPDDIGKIQNGTIKVQVKAVDPYSPPDKATVTVAFENGSLIDFAPQPDKKNVVLNFRLYSESDKIIPLSNEVLFETLSNSGTPIYKQIYHLEDPVYLPAKGEQKIILDLLIPKTLLEISLDKTAIVTFFYNKSIEKSDKEFSYDFELSKEKLTP